MCIFWDNQFHNVCILTGRRARALVPHLIHSVSAGGSVQWLRSSWFWGPNRSILTSALVLFSDVHPPFTKGGWMNIALAKIFDSITGSVFKRRILGANSISWYAKGLPPIQFCTNFLRQTDGFTLDHTTMQIANIQFQTKCFDIPISNSYLF